MDLLDRFDVFELKDVKEILGHVGLDFEEAHPVMCPPIGIKIDDKMYYFKSAVFGAVKFIKEGKGEKHFEFE